MGTDSDSEDDERIKRSKWVPALVIGGQATPRQRKRNFAFYERIRDGVPNDYHQGGLKQFVFEVPAESCELGPASPSNGGRSHFTFRLDPSSDCYRRLVSYVVGHTASDCDADHSVDQLRKMLRHALDLFDAHPEPHVIVKDVFADMRAQLDAFEQRHNLPPVKEG